MSSGNPEETSPNTTEGLGKALLQTMFAGGAGIGCLLAFLSDSLDPNGSGMSPDTKVLLTTFGLVTLIRAGYCGRRVRDILSGHR